MKKLLIVDSSEPFIESLISALHTTHEIRYCADSETALALLHSFRPDKMVLNTSLQGSDSLRVLQYSGYMPPIVLVITTLADPILLQSLQDFGVTNVMRIPCKIDAVVGYLNSMEHIVRLPCRSTDPQRIIYSHLRLLALQEGRNGFRQLCVGIPLFAQDRQQSLSKEVYPRIAQICGNDNGDQVESTIRRLIKDAWRNRNAAVWDSYFPGYRKAPCNKQFISVLSDLIDYLYPTSLLAENE